MDENKKENLNFKSINERVHSLNVYIFLGFNLTLISVLGFILIKSSLNSVV